jgi:hypothetical protein
LLKNMLERKKNQTYYEKSLKIPKG